MLQNISMHIQAPLIHVINEDDELLYNSEHSPWYRIIKDFPDGDYLEIAANYCNCLYHFNLSCRQTKPSSAQNDETKDQAEQRLLFDRPTMVESQPVMFEKPDPPAVTRKVTPDMTGPGITPDRLAGKKPKCFFALFKSFIGASLMGFESEPGKVHFLLMSNLSFARVCGFIPKDENSDYWHKHVPSLRKIQQFDQIMTDCCLWDVCRRNEVMNNIA